jgi:hypothetical protein
LPDNARAAMVGISANIQIKKFICITGYLFTKSNLISESNITNSVYPDKPNTTP